jgi:beta-phosphoglucomutase
MPPADLAVIFDVDGVLVDSWDAHYRSWSQLAAECDVPFTEADFAASFGMTSDEVIRRHWSSPDGPPSPDRIAVLDDRKERLYRELVDREFPPIPGAAELIDALHAAGVPLAVGSSGPPENVGLVLERLGRRQRFAAVVSRADVVRGKPAPDIFLEAGRRLGVPASRCVVIEDAPAGVAAARAAGMRVMALLSTGRHREDFHDLTPDGFTDCLRRIGPADLAALLEV